MFWGKAKKTYIQKPTSFVDPLTGVRTGIMTKGNIQFPSGLKATSVVRDEVKGIKMGLGLPSSYMQYKFGESNRAITDSQIALATMDFKGRQWLEKNYPKLIEQIQRGYGYSLWEGTQVRTNPTGSKNVVKTYKVLNKQGQIVAKTELKGGIYDKWGNLKKAVTESFVRSEKLNPLTGKIETIYERAPQSARFEWTKDWTDQSEVGFFTKALTSKQSALAFETSRYIPGKGVITLKGRNTKTVFDPFADITYGVEVKTTKLPSEKIISKAKGIISMDESLQVSKGPFKKIKETAWFGDQAVYKEGGVFNIGEQTLYKLRKESTYKPAISPLFIDTTGRIGISLEDYAIAGKKQVYIPVSRLAAKTQPSLSVQKDLIKEIKSGQVKTIQTPEGNVYKVVMKAGQPYLSLRGKPGSAFPLEAVNKEIFGSIFPRMDISKRTITPYSTTFGKKEIVTPRVPTEDWIKDWYKGAKAAAKASKGKVYPDITRVMQRGTEDVLPGITSMEPGIQPLLQTRTPSVSKMFLSSPMTTPTMEMKSLKFPTLTPVTKMPLAFPIALIPSTRVSTPTVPRMIPTITPRPSLTPTLTPTPTTVPTLVPTVVPIIVPTITPTVTPTITPTVTPVVTPIVTPIITPTITPRTTPQMVPNPLIIPPRVPIKRRLPIKDEEERRRRKKKGSPGYLVFTKKFGKPLLLTKAPIEKGKALALGVKVTKSSARASFELVPTKRKAVFSPLQPITETKVYSMGFRAPIRKGRLQPSQLKFVQKRSTRLGTRAEVLAVKSYRRSGIW
jgi:hypothetical protein